MDIYEAVKDKANYNEIVQYFKNMKTLSMEDLVALIDTIDCMSEEIFEHYKTLRDICRDELQKNKRIYQEHGSFDFLEDSDQRRLAYIVTKACGMGILVTEKYEDMAKALISYL